MPIGVTMRKAGLLFFTFVCGVLLLASGLGPEATAGAWVATSMVNGDLTDRSSDLVVKIKKKKKKHDDDGNNNTTQQGEHICPEGYVVLDKPNKYGAFCEPKEGLPKTSPAEPEKCKFGMIGTPPNDCHCPEGMEFAGYKGCIPIPKPCEEVGVLLKDHAFCRSDNGRKADCRPEANDLWTCCCRVGGPTF